MIDIKGIRIDYGNKIVTDGLVLHLDAANPQSYDGNSTTWRDLSGNDNNGTLLNGIVYTGSNKGCLVFDGVNDYCEISNLILASPTIAAVTLDVWFINFSNNSYTGLIGRSSWGVNGYSIGFNSLSSLKFTCSISDSGFENNVSYDSSVMSNGVFIFDGNTIYIYRNGVFINSYTSSFNFISSTFPMLIGSNGQGGWSYSNISISTVKVYYKHLTQQEITQNYNATKNRFI